MTSSRVPKSPDAEAKDTKASARGSAASPKTPAGQMPITGHLVEMRNRLFKAVAVVIVTTAVAFIFHQQIFDFLLHPAGPDFAPVRQEMMEGLSTFFRVCLTAGIAVAMPFLVYQLFAFVSPALTAKEKRYIYWILPGVTVMFLAGITFAYFVALPPALGMLIGFGADFAVADISIKDYINIVTRMLLVIGLVFETPVIIMFLARMGLVTSKWLAARRKLWFVLAFVIAAIITPTFDPINQTIIALPLVILLELSIFLAKFVYKKRAEPSPAGV